MPEDLPDMGIHLSKDCYDKFTIQRQVQHGKPFQGCVSCQLWPSKVFRNVPFRRTWKLSSCTGDRVTVFFRLKDGVSFITFKCQLRVGIIKKLDRPV